MREADKNGPVRSCLLLAVLRFLASFGRAHVSLTQIEIHRPIMRPASFSGWVGQRVHWMRTVATKKWPGSYNPVGSDADWLYGPLETGGGLLDAAPPRLSKSAARAVPMALMLSSHGPSSNWML